MEATFLNRASSDPHPKGHFLSVNFGGPRVYVSEEEEGASVTTVSTSMLTCPEQGATVTLKSACNNNKPSQLNKPALK